MTIAIALAGSASAQTADNTSKPNTNLFKGCFESPPSGRIVILSQHGGKGPAVSYKLGKSEAINRVTTVTGSGSDDVVLILMGHDSIIWDVSKISKRVKAVYASGIHPQGVSGLRSGVPIRFTHGAIAGTPYGSGICPVLSYIGDAREIQNGVTLVRSVFGRWPSDLHETYSTPTFSIDGGPLTDMPMTPPASAVRAGVNVDTTDFINGDGSLRQMIKNGILAPTNRSDLQNWKNRGARITNEAFTGGREVGDESDLMPWGDMYLVTRNIDKIPTGLGNGRLVTFVLPEGIQAPIDTNIFNKFLRINGMKGVPKTTGGNKNPSADFERYALMPLAPGYQPHHVQWNADGSVRSETPSVNDNDPSHSGSYHQSVQDYLTGKARPSPLDDMRRPTKIIQMTSTQDPEEDKTLSVLFVLVITFGTIGLVIYRKLAGAKNNNKRSRHKLVNTSLPSVQHDNPDDLIELTNQLQEAIDLSQDDETALVLIKFKRTVIEALKGPEYDGDLANELDAIVESHLPQTLYSYRRAARRKSGGQVMIIEVDLRETVARLTKRVEEIIAIQSKREADKMREIKYFIRARHNDEFEDQI
jgi:hypothetical protein